MVSDKIFQLFWQYQTNTNSFLKVLTKVLSSVVYFRHSKAFDTVNHNILIAKLSHYGIRSTLLQLIRSSVTNRMQYVHLSEYNSECLVVKCRVP